MPKCDFIEIAPQQGCSPVHLVILLEQLLMGARLEDYFWKAS